MSGAKQKNNKVILTENTLKFERSQVSIITGIINDLTVIPTNGRPGDLLITVAGDHYKKNDMGLSTDWTLLGSGGGGGGPQATVDLSGGGIFINNTTVLQRLSNTFLRIFTAGKPTGDTTPTASSSIQIFTGTQNSSPSPSGDVVIGTGNSNGNSGSILLSTGNYTSLLFGYFTSNGDDSNTLPDSLGSGGISKLTPAANIPYLNTDPVVNQVLTMPTIIVRVNPGDGPLTVYAVPKVGHTNLANAQLEVRFWARRLY